MFGQIDFDQIFDERKVTRIAILRELLWVENSDLDVRKSSGILQENRFQYQDT